MPSFGLLWHRHKGVDLRETLCLLRAGRRRKTWKIHARARLGPMADTLYPMSKHKPRALADLAAPMPSGAALAPREQTPPFPSSWKSFLFVFTQHKPCPSCSTAGCDSELCKRQQDGPGAAGPAVASPEHTQTCPDPAVASPGHSKTCPDPAVASLGHTWTCLVPGQPQDLHTDRDQAEIKLLAQHFPQAGAGDGTGTLQYPGCLSLCPSLPSPEVLLWGCQCHQCPCLTSLIHSCMGTSPLS